MRTSGATAPTPGGDNEDLYRTGPGWAAVLDGAGRYPGRRGGCVHAVTWVVAHLGLHLESLLSAQPDSPLPVVLAGAIEATRGDHGPACDLSDPLSPGAAVAVARARGEWLEWLVLSDAAVVIERATGEYLVVIDDRVDSLRSAPIVDRGTVRTYDPDYVARVRNQPGGFWVAGAVPAAADEAYVGRVPLAGVSRLMLCSDGVTRLTERYDWKWGDVFDLVASAGPDAVIDAVRAEEASDPDPGRWRGKRHDDATLVYASQLRPTQPRD